MARRKIDGLDFKAGPTQSGLAATPTPSSTPLQVGGEMMDINLVSVILSKYWPLVVIMLVPFAFVLYKKRSAVPKWFFRLMFLLKGL
jgi:hypothetical protein